MLSYFLGFFKLQFYTDIFLKDIFYLYVSLLSGKNTVFVRSSFDSDLVVKLDWKITFILSVCVFMHVHVCAHV